MNETILRADDSIKDGPTTLPSPNTRLATPLGSEILSISSKRKIDVSEENSEGFKTIVLPHIKAGIIFLITVDNGKFHGVMSNATPSGS